MENIAIPKGDVSAQTDLVQKHMMVLRQIYPNNPVLLICEANMSCKSAMWCFYSIPKTSQTFLEGICASHFAHMCQPYNVTPVKDEKSGMVGVITTSQTKENGVLLLQSILQDGRIMRAENCLTVGNSAWVQQAATNIEGRFDVCVQDILMQLSKFKKVVKEGNDIFQKTKVEYSGKDGASQDDLVMAYIIGVYFITKFSNGSLS